MDERRYYGFDALRGGMMILGIVVHACMFYLAEPLPGQHLFTDSTQSPVFDWLFLFIHNFRMPLFFLLSGFFTALLVEKRGLWGTYRNRAARVLAPLVAGTLTVVPLATLFLLSMMVTLRVGTHELVPEWSQFMALRDEAHALGYMPKDPAPAHLWFLYYLCWMYLFIPLSAWLARASVRAAAARKLLASPAGLVVLGLVTTATLLPIPGGLLMPNSFTLSPNWSHLYYGSFFTIGYVLHAHRDSLAVYPRFLGWTLPLAIVLFPLAEHLMRVALAAPGSATAQLAAALTNAVCTWAIIYVALGATLRWFDTASPWALYLSQSSYWVYLTHLPAVAFGGWALLGVDWPAEAKFLAIVAFTTVTCFVSYHYAVQRTWISAFLNGKRFDLDWPWRKPVGVPVPR
ncbi:MAG: acyltransferase family protein [Gammaproteobacteria bacterium]